MSPETLDKVMNRRHTMPARDERVCGCTWVKPYAKQPYRSRTCQAHLPPAQVLLDMPSVR